MSEIKNDPRLKQAAEEAIAKAADRRVISFTLDGETYWIKRKMGNGRKQFAKYSVEKEFYFEVAKMTIAGRAAPLLVPEILVLTPDYMVTKDGGRTLKNWLDSDMPEEDKQQLLEEAGRALYSLHQAGIVHGRPALRDITWKEGNFTFLDWENRMFTKDIEEQKAVDLILLLHGLAREDYREEGHRMEALDRGYLAQGGEKTRENAIRLFRKHGVLYRIVKALSPFHMVDVEAARKVCEYLLNKE